MSGDQHYTVLLDQGVLPFVDYIRGTACMRTLCWYRDVQWESPQALSAMQIERLGRVLKKLS